MKREFAIAAVFVFVALAFIVSINPASEKFVYFSSDGKNVTLKVSVADTDELRMKGLMFVSKLGENEGMLFVYNDEQKRTFWMKNTLIPLDMIFVAANGTVVGIVENTQPCEKDPCETYQSKYPAKYVVESNAGFAKENNISAGSSKLNSLYKTGV